VSCLIAFADERNVDTFATRVVARRRPPAGDAVDAFIEEQERKKNHEVA
jgi:hypothetical protein